MHCTIQNMPEPNSTVVVGMSGGVDSTLTAYMLKQNGCKVIGVTMSLWDGHIQAVQNDGCRDTCYSPHEEEDIAECKQFCEKHNIEYHVLDVSESYNRLVLDYVTSEYRSGRTPNPCIRCNSLIKFGALLDGLQNSRLDYDYFCTGHYAAVVRPDEGLFGTECRPCMIAVAADKSKDQSYFLYRLPSDLLEKVRFPLASLPKSEVFRLAREADIAAAERKESQDFIAAPYFKALFADKPSCGGNVLDDQGNIIGTHSGIEHYTIGQRKGFSVRRNDPVYIQSINASDNTITVVPKDKLLSPALLASDMVWPGGIIPNKPFRAVTKIRLRSPAAAATVELTDNPSKWRIVFDEPQSAVTPGQSVVLYQDDVIVGGGVIEQGL